MSTYRRRVGIEQVATAAGVSVTTVSHALNGKGRLPEQTREHVRRVAEQLGYRPSVAARSLVAGKTGLLGLVISQPVGSAVRFADFAYFTQLMMAASATAINAGYALVLTSGDHALGAGGGITIDGAVVVDPVARDPLVEELIATGVPTVTTGRIVGARDDNPWVDNDHRAGALSVLKTNPVVMSYTVDVEDAYREWCADHDMPPRVSHVGADLTESAGYAAAQTLLSLEPKPDAIYATYDRLGVGALLAARAVGISVPSDLLIAVTATESSEAAATRPSLTALSLHPDQIGERAAAMLIALVEGRVPDDVHAIVPTRLIPRMSTRRAPSTAAARRTRSPS
jgi:DNA-binding LacI/PurR family transcriptional regulator